MIGAMFGRGPNDASGAQRPPDRELFPAMPRLKAKGALPRVVARPASPLEERGGPPALEELGSPGTSSLLLGRPSPEPYRIFRMLAGGRKALAASGTHPARLRARFGLDETELVWLTAYSGSSEEALGPQTLEYELLGRATRHFRRARGSMLFLDDIDYLVSQRGFGPLARFLKSICDAGAEARGTLLVSADPDAFSERELASLRPLFDNIHLVQNEDAPARIGAGPLLSPPVSCLVRGNGPGAYGLLEQASRTRRALCMTPHAPRKLKQAHDLSRADFLWLSESASGEGVLRPQKLAYEGLRAGLRHLRSGKGALVFLDGLERLRLYGELPDIVRFVKGLVDAAADCGGMVMASLEPGTLDPREEAVLRKRFETELC